VKELDSIKLKIQGTKITQDTGDFTGYVVYKHLVLQIADRQEAYQHTKSYAKYAVLRALSLFDSMGLHILVRIFRLGT
jgi:hypothetical protein